MTKAHFPVPVFDTPLRTYVLLHTYFKSLLNGVQGGHACVELSIKYEPGTLGAAMYKQWSRVDKTLLFLDGGVSLHLHAMLNQLRALENNGSKLVWAHFVEDEATLEGMLTAVAIILPERIAKAHPEDWDAAKLSMAGPIHDDLVKLGMTTENSIEFLSVIDCLRSRPLAS